jgi:hypothetical protein
LAELNGATPTWVAVVAMVKVGMELGQALLVWVQM